MTKKIEKKSVYDVVVIGGGITGTIMGKFALKYGLKTLIIERQSKVGGLWNKLPDWQDIQSRNEDWSLNGIKVNGVKKSDIVSNIEDWSNHPDLKKRFRFDTKVEEVLWENGVWNIQTDKENLKSSFVVVATGLHNSPFIPVVLRSNSSIREFHSSVFFDQASLKNRKVAVVGSGASALDLLELALSNDAKEIHWIYRNFKWMVPTRRSKHNATNLRRLALMQICGLSPQLINLYLNRKLKKAYLYHGIENLIPDMPLDLNETQLIPGRPLLIDKISQIKQHKDSILKISDNSILMKGGSFEADVLLWATGFKFDIGFNGLSKLNSIGDGQELSKRCGSLFYSLDYPNLFFLGSTFLDTVSSTPFLAAVGARSIVSHILGKSKFPNKPVLRRVNHWDVLKLMAKHDRWNYPPLSWRWKYLKDAIQYYRNPKQVVFIE